MPEAVATPAGAHPVPPCTALTIASSHIGIHFAGRPPYPGLAVRFAHVAGLLHQLQKPITKLRRMYLTQGRTCKARAAEFDRAKNACLKGCASLLSWRCTFRQVSKLFKTNLCDMCTHIDSLFLFSQ